MTDRRGPLSRPVGPSSPRAAVGGVFLRRLRSWTLPLGVFVGFIVAWEAIIRIFGIQRAILPSPTGIAGAFVNRFPELSAAAAYTFVEALGGLLIGVAAGIGVALLAARWADARHTLLPFAIAVNAVPIVAFAPIANNWFGLASPVSKMVIAGVIVFFPVMINTVRGLTLVDPSALELMRAYAFSERTILLRLRIPNALPFVFTALKIATTLSLIGAVVGEYFGAPLASLGQYIVQAAAFFGFERSWAAIIWACGMGVAFYLAVLALERIVIPWHASLRAPEVA